MKCIISVTAHDEYFDGSPSYCIVEITPGYARDLLYLMNEVNRLKQSNFDVYQLSVFDYRPAYYAYNEKLEELYESIKSENDFRIIDEKLSTGNDSDMLDEVRKATIRTLLAKVDSADTVAADCCSVTIFSECISYEGYVKHTNVLFKSGSIHRDTLQMIAQLDATGGSYE